MIIERQYASKQSARTKRVSQRAYWWKVVKENESEKISNALNLQKPGKM